MDADALYLIGTLLAVAGGAIGLYIHDWATGLAALAIACLCAAPIV